MTQHITEPSVHITQKFLDESDFEQVKIGTTVEGPIVNIDRGRIYIDIHPHGTAIIYGKEYLSARDMIKNLGVGDFIEAKIIDTENKDGYIEVSLREARQNQIWGDATEIMGKKSLLTIPVKAANKGGLILEWQGMTGFLPASQLGAENYPKVPDGDKDKIFTNLKNLVGEQLTVTIITADRQEGKLIFSEKAVGTPNEKDMQTISQSEEFSATKTMDDYGVGDELNGIITGVTEFGAFIRVEGGMEGLVHISELDWGLIDNPKELYKPGQQVRVKIIEINDGKISLSIKALKENPWVSAKAKYKQGDEVNAVIIKYNQHGALASIEEGVAGLVHVSEFGDLEAMREQLRLGTPYKFTISIFNPEQRKMTLLYNQGKVTKEDTQEE
jgi:small subunit ribosomal protein S1